MVVANSNPFPPVVSCFSLHIFPTNNFDPKSFQILVFLILRNIPGDNFLAGRIYPMCIAIFREDVLQDRYKPRGSVIAVNTCRDNGLAADTRFLHLCSLCASTEFWFSVSIEIFFCKFTSILTFKLLHFHSAYLELKVSLAFRCLKWTFLM